MNDILTTKEMCELLRIHQTTLYKACRASKIPHFRVGSDYRFVRKAVMEWLGAEPVDKAES